MPPKKRKSGIATTDPEQAPLRQTKRARVNHASVQETAISSRPKQGSRKGQVGDMLATERPAIASSTTRSLPKDSPGRKGAGAKDTVGSGRIARSPEGKRETLTTASDASGSHRDGPIIAWPTGSKERDADGGEGRRSYWLMKAEPESRFEKGVDVKFSIDDLHDTGKPEAWDGVRNAGARNNMRAMKKGDLAFFYHSNCKVPGIAGIMEIVQEHSVDGMAQHPLANRNLTFGGEGKESAFDPANPYYDEKSSRENPKWEVVHVEFRRKFDDLVKLSELKSFGKPGGPLENLQLLKQSRLSVSAVTGEQWRFIMGLVADKEGKTVVETT